MSAVEFELVTRGGHPDFLDLPWGTPLAEWNDDRLVKMAHGVSRHVVRFVRFDERVYALKQTEARVAESEYRMLNELRDAHLPVVEPVGHVRDSPGLGDGVLITRYLDFSLPYWYLFGRTEPLPAERLLDAAVVLLVRLHLDNVFWGDCSLSNILWRRDAGAVMAYLVDAETTERQDTIGDGMRDYDLAIAEENMIGGLMDLQAAGRVGADLDPHGFAVELRRRYERLWAELTREETFAFDQRWRIERRVRRINDLGFDVDEMSISSDGSSVHIKPVLIDEGHHHRALRRRTGLEVQENQARRLLADIDQYGAWLEQVEERVVPGAVAAARWLADVYEPLIESVPDELAQRLEAAELFHQLLEHRYFMSERDDRQVSTDEALADYLEQVLSKQPSEMHLEIDDIDAIDDEE